MVKEPPYRITSVILKQVEAIGRELGLLEFSGFKQGQVQLRRENKVRSIQSSLAIEGNTLSIDEVLTIFNGQKPAGPKKDILETENAVTVYKDLLIWDGLSKDSFLKAHNGLMNNLVADAGTWRKKGVAVYKGDQVSHMAPPAHRVESLMDNLFDYLKEDNGPWLIKACVFHYELEFIHPFSDGNGRMGRLWQQILLMRDEPLFEYVPVESIIKRYQAEYYETLRACDEAADATRFIEFSLEKILIALTEMPKRVSAKLGYEDRIAKAKKQFGQNKFSRKQNNDLFEISTATASRDLKMGVDHGILDKEGNKSTSRYWYR